MATDDFFGLRSYRPCSITIATPGVITSEAHGLQLADKVVFSTTGALPTGITADTFYFVVLGTYSDGSTDNDTFSIASSRANALAGTKITTSGSQSGAHYFYSTRMRRLAPSYESNK